MLVAFEARYRREALEQHRFATVQWALLAPHVKRPGRAPKRPRILEDPPHGLS